MPNEETVNFDLSALSLDELVSLNDKVTDFIAFLSAQKKEEEDPKGDDKNE